jgi:hypothetical protein
MKRLPSQKVHRRCSGEGSEVDYALRFLTGGLMVTAFATLGDVLRPKSFAGLFGAAPSVALATLSLALFKQGGIYVSVEGRSMMIGALALAIYSVVVCQLLMRLRASAIMATGSALAVWFALSLGLKQLLIG